MSNGGIKGDDLYMSIDDSVKKPYGGKITGSNQCLACSSDIDWSAVVDESRQAFTERRTTAIVEVSRPLTKVSQGWAVDADILVKCPSCGVMNRFKNILYVARN